MIRQEKRKRRWLEKNGFTFVTLETMEQFNQLCNKHKRPVLKPELYFAYKPVVGYTLNMLGEDEIYLISNEWIKSDLHNIKLHYIDRTTPRGVLNKWGTILYELNRIKSQWSVLIKHGVNPWW